MIWEQRQHVGYWLTACISVLEGARIIHAGHLLTNTKTWLVNYILFMMALVLLESLLDYGNLLNEYWRYRLKDSARKIERECEIKKNVS